MIFLIEEKDLNIEDKITVLYFYASWMPFHKKFISMFAKIELLYKNILCYGINVNDFKSLCVKYNVNSIPEVIIIKNKQEIKRINGLILFSALKSAFNDIFKNKEQCNEKC